MDVRQPLVLRLPKKVRLRLDLWLLKKVRLPLDVKLSLEVRPPLDASLVVEWLGCCSWFLSGWSAALAHPQRCQHRP